MINRLDELIEKYLISEEEDFESKHPGFAWASEALRCSRQVGFRIAEEPVTEDLPLYSRWNFMQGNYLHKVVQEAIGFHYGLAYLTEVDWSMDGISGRADAMSEDTIIELKTINSFGFRKAVFDSRGKAATGPEPAAIMQGFLNAEGLRRDARYKTTAKLVKVIYVTKEPSLAKPIVSKVWTYKWTDARTREVEAEIRRLQSISNLVRAGGGVPKPIFGGKLITAPASVNFPCGYCAYKAKCIELGPGGSS